VQRVWQTARALRRGPPAPQSGYSSLR
jgi:hypothetical protein